MFGGLYSANGVGYNEILFAGLGIGFYGHSGLVEDNDLNSTFSIPFLLDLRYRPFKKYKFSPIIMLATGVSYYDGSIGTFTLNSGLGVSVKLSERLHGQLLFCHTYERYSAQLSVNNKLIEDFYKGIYLNYAGPRIGVSYKF